VEQMAQMVLAELVVDVAIQAFRFLCHVDGMKVAWALGSGKQENGTSSGVHRDTSASHESHLASQTWISNQPRSLGG
jgi:hypothetical protein